MISHSEGGTRPIEEHLRLQRTSVAQLEWESRKNHAKIETDGAMEKEEEAEEIGLRKGNKIG